MKITKPTATDINKDGYKTGGVDVESRFSKLAPRS